MIRLLHLLAGCSLAAASALPAQTYRFATDPWIAWAPVWAAQELGLWKKRGVDVEVVGFTGGDTVAAFKAGKVDFAMVMAGTAVGIQIGDGIAVKVLAEVDWSHGGDKMLVEKGVQLAQLKKQRIGIYEDSPAVHMFLAAKLHQQGLSAADFEVVVLEDVESLTSQFLAGRVACAITYEPYAQQATEKGLCEVIATTADFPGVMPECIAVRADKLARMPPAHVAAVLQGWIEAVEWCQDPKNDAAFTRLCVERVFAEEKVEPAEIPAMLKNVRIHGRQALRERNLGPDGIRRFLTDCVAFALRKAGKEPKAVDPAAMLDTRALAEALGPAAAPPPAR